MDKAKESSVWEEASGWLRSILYERTVSPLLPSFVVSWLVLNYRMVFTLLSDEQVEDKLRIIDTVLYPSLSVLVLQGLVVPAIAAFTYLFLYPWPARWVYQYSLRRQRELFQAKQRIEAERVLTVEQSQRIRDTAHRNEANLRREIDERDERIASLSQQLEFATQRREIDDGNTAPRGNPEEIRESNTARGSSEEETILRLMHTLENTGQTRVSQQAIIDMIRPTIEDVTQIKAGIQRLVEKKMLTRGYTKTGEKLEFSHAGRVAALGIVNAEHVSAAQPNPPSNDARSSQVKPGESWRDNAMLDGLPSAEQAREKAVGFALPVDELFAQITQSIEANSSMGKREIVMAFPAGAVTDQDLKQALSLVEQKGYKAEILANGVAAGQRMARITW